MPPLCPLLVIKSPRPAWLAPPGAPSADWVRDVAWAPSFGLPMNTLASAGQDGKVLVWSERQEGERWGWQGFLGAWGCVPGRCLRKWSVPGGAAACSGRSALNYLVNSSGCWVGGTAAPPTATPARPRSLGAMQVQGTQGFV